MELVATGVELRLEREARLEPVPKREAPVDRPPDKQVIAAQSFAEVLDNGRRKKWPSGSTSFYDLPPRDTDPTTGLLGMAYGERQNLGGLLGDLRRANDYDITRWEFYALPFRVELRPELFEHLRGTWKERDPKPPGAPLILS